jgi:acetylornithine deacetylase/succinyl-diaminopimelate desuccinylase-like protein
MTENADRVPFRQAAWDGALELPEHVSALMGRARSDLAELVAIPSVADARQYPPSACEQAAAWVRDRFAEVGFADAGLERTADGSLAVVGSRPGPDPAAPTVLLYAHYDVQPAQDESAWRTRPFELTEVDGRWYGRGAADCKGNIVMHLTALRALADAVPVNLKLVVEGSEEQGTGGLEAYVPAHADRLRADAILVCDTGNAAVGVPAVTVSLRGMVNAVVTVETLNTDLHSGMFGGPAPDALTALIRMLNTLHDDVGNTVIAGLDDAQVWEGTQYPADQFRSDAGVLDGVSLAGDGTVADMLWARSAVTVVGIDCPPVVGSATALQPRARARLNLRVPPGVDPDRGYEALEYQLKRAAPGNARVTVEQEASGAPFRARTGGPAYAALAIAMREAYGRSMTTLGQGGSIPLCNVLADTYPDAEIVLLGVEDPQCLMHAPNESVDPSEIQHLALAEALFLRRYATTR